MSPPSFGRTLQDVMKAANVITATHVFKNCDFIFCGWLSLTHQCSHRNSEVTWIGCALRQLLFVANLGQSQAQCWNYVDGASRVFGKAEICQSENDKCIQRSTQTLPYLLMVFFTSFTPFLGDANQNQWADRLLESLYLIMIDYVSIEPNRIPYESLIDTRTEPRVFFKASRSCLTSSGLLRLEMPGMVPQSLSCGHNMSRIILNTRTKRHGPFHCGRPVAAHGETTSPAKLQA